MPNDTLPATTSTILELPNDLRDFFRAKAKNEGRLYSSLLIEQLQQRRRQLEEADAKPG